ncbi:MAG: response regulator transcription factor [Finegoldia sp.]|nr:response regulator transcription factor [Finegoldia sp.]
MSIKVLLAFPKKKYKDEIILNFSNDQNYEITESSTIAETMDKLNKSFFDILLTDMNFSDGTGLDLRKKISDLYTIPTIFVSDVTESTQKILALEYGGDDYIEYPFNMLELKSRIRAVLRRCNNEINLGQNTNVIDAGEFEFNLLDRTVKRDGDLIDLTGREFELLYTMVINKDKILSREEIADKLWDNSKANIRTVDVHIKRLREKIKDNDSTIIRTKWGKGYYFSSKK